MREFSTPPTVEVPRVGNLTYDVVSNALRHPTTPVLARRDASGAWSDVTAAQFFAEVAAAAKGLIAAGIAHGDRVALLSRTRWEWTVVDYAIWCAGAVTVPIYETSSVEQLAWILEDSGAKAIVVEDSAHAERVDDVRSSLRSLAHVWVIEEGAVADLAALGREVSDADLESRRTQATPDDLATLVYTSGTTGRPKGCMLTHGSLMSEIELATHELPEIFDEGGSTLLFLPLAHVFARVVQLGCMRARVRLAHSSDIRHLTTALGELEPTFVFGVPRVFEKLFNAASQQATADGKGRLFDRAVETAIAWSRAQDAGKVPLRLRAEHALFARTAYGRLHAALGGRSRFAFSAGAPLGERLGHFYRGIGVTVLEGYGLTETSGALTVNSTAAHKVGTVGRPLPGTAVRVSDDGELLVRGPQVFTGYWNDPEATAEALDATGGWFHTGDVGEVDDEGFVRVTGRKKELLVTAGGKNVAPAVLEDRLRSHAIISQCMVVGDGEPFIGALVTIDPDTFEQWSETHGKRGTVADLVDDPDLLAEVQRAVDDTNNAVSQAEAIRKFTVLPHDWTEEDGQLTPSLKLKRAVVMREFRREVAALYGR